METGLHHKDLISHQRKKTQSTTFKIITNRLNDLFNRSSRRKRGMASNPLLIIPEFFLHFPNELSYGYLRFEGNNGKIPLGR